MILRRTEITFHTLLPCFVKKLPIEILFLLSAFFSSQNGRMLTSSDPDQRSVKFGSVSNSSEWCFLLKFGRWRTALLMNRADFLRISHFSASSLVHSYKIWLMIAPRE